MANTGGFDAYTPRENSGEVDNFGECLAAARARA
jgi:hypothetical protein